MNNTNKMLMIAAITSLLVMGTSLVQMKSFAGGDEHKQTKDFKSSISAKFQSDKKSANQHMGQENFAYRSNGADQANQGQQLAGKDNSAKGFNDQSDNLTPAVSSNSTTNSTG
jgi:hypothetical protein